MGEQLTLRGTLMGHTNWVTSLATPSEDNRMLLSASRDKTVRPTHAVESPGAGDDHCMRLLNSCAAPALGSSHPFRLGICLSATPGARVDH